MARKIAARRRLNIVTSNARPAPPFCRESSRSCARLHATLGGMRVRAAVVMAIAMTGCVASDSYVCSDGTVCPANTVCAPIPHATNAPSGELCVDPDAISACTGKADNATCDDGIRVSGDGCDSNCLLESAAWKQLATDNVALRRTPMAYDIAHDQMVMFGGKPTGTFSLSLGGTAVFTGRAWQEASPRTIPRPRNRAALAYDSVRNRVVMFGGSDPRAAHFYNETWQWEGHDWQQAEPPPSPPARDGATMVFDSKRGRMILFGGRTRGPEGVSMYCDSWRWDG